MKKIKYKVGRLLNFLFPFLFILIVDSFYNYYNFNVFFELSSAGALILSLIIIYLLFILLVGITKSFKKANISLLIFVFLILIINEVKIFYTDMPFYLSDLYYLFNITEIIGFTDSTLLSFFKEKIIFFLIQFVVFFFLIIVIKKNKCVEINNIKWYVIVLPIIVLVVLVIPSPLTNNIILNGLLQSNNIQNYNYYTEDKQYYMMYGVLSGMYTQMLEERIFEPPTYNENAIEKTLNQYDSYVSSNIIPNIIFIFSESFWDVDKLTEVKFDKEITSNFKKLSKKGKLLEMISPTYGGMSGNVEFELLTGANTAFYNNAYIPYMRMYNNDSSSYKPSIIKELKDNGYITTIVSTASEKLYNCNQVYKYFKVDNVEFLDSVSSKNIKGYYPSDDFIANKIISDFNNKDNKPNFYMAFTMQAHMPYLREKYNKYDIDIIKSNLTQEENDVLLSYAQGIYDADKQLGKLYEFIKGYNEPTILVFLGDHLPYLKTVSNVNLVEKLEYFNTNNEKINIYRKYNTQVLVLSNYDIEYDDTKYLGPDILFPYLLQQNSLNLSPYYQYLLKSKGTLPSFNRQITVDNGGNIYYTNKLNNEFLEVYNMRNNIQYKFFNKE